MVNGEGEGLGWAVASFGSKPEHRWCSASIEVERYDEYFDAVEAMPYKCALIINLDNGAIGDDNWDYPCDWRFGLLAGALARLYEEVGK